MVTVQKLAGGGDVFSRNSEIRKHSKQEPSENWSFHLRSTHEKTRINAGVSVMTTGYGSLFLQGRRYRERDVIKEITQGCVLEKTGQRSRVETSTIFALLKF